MTAPYRSTISAISGLPVLAASGVVSLGVALVLGQINAQNLAVVGASGTLCFVAAGLSLVVTSLMARSRVEGIAHGIIAGMLLRTSFAIVGLIVLTEIGLSSRPEAGGWILYWYLTFLVVEVAWLAKKLSTATGTQEAPTC